MKNFRLAGLDCPVCAQRIEDGVRAIEGVSSVSIDFGSLTMRLEAANIPLVTEAIRRIEPSVTIEPIERGGAGTARGTAGGRPGQAGGQGPGTQASCAACSDDHDHDPSLAHDHECERAPRSRTRFLRALSPETRHELAFLGAAILLSGAAYLLPALGASDLPLVGPFLAPLLFIAAWLLSGHDVLRSAIRNILRGRVFDELFLMGLATFGAILIGQYAEAVGVMVFYKIGEALQETAAARSRASIRGLLDLRPDQARLKRDGTWSLLPAGEAGIGESFLVLPGERIPLDGVVTEGEALVDTQALTGEPRPRRAAPGTEILAGTLALDGALEARSTRLSGESSAARIAELVENASHSKARTERFISRFARVYTPIVVGAAALLAFLPPILGLDSLADSAYRALVLLVISCPCALVISVPLGYFGGMGGAARRGILVKGGTVLDALARVKTAVFDKTGTLTKGVFAVRGIVVPAGAGDGEEAVAAARNQVLELAALAESRSRHPIAASIREAARGRGLADGTEDEASGVRELPGLGVAATIGSRRVLVGNAALLEREGIAAGAEAAPAGLEGCTRVQVAADGAWIGTIHIGDEAKPDAAAAIAALRGLGVERAVILTGDEAGAADALAKGLGVAEVHAGLLPEDKLSRLEAIIADTDARGGTTIFVGDGVNDAPVLARADIGAAMGAGADAAVECADLVLMNDDPSSVAEAIARARRTRLIVMENIVGALAIKSAFLVLGALGVAVMWEAVIADVGVALLATLNSTRAVAFVPARDNH